MPHSWLPGFRVAVVLMVVVEHNPSLRWCISYTTCAHSPCSVRCVVTAKTQYNLKNAREYFEEHLCVGDYYNEGQRVAGEWIGLGAERLGLSGKVRADDFLRLCENQHPSAGETLTQRMNTTRTEDGENAANRRIFYDFTFSPPKSVSIAAFVGKDERILEAHSRAVKTAVREFEAFAATRVRTSGAQSDRLTGNFAAALFTHDTSRALDPHLHTHCIVFNATFDPVENRWKALQNYELLRARKFAENAYYHELARELRSFGYQIRNRARGDFQVEGVSDELCERFSKQRAEIDKALAKLLEEKPELVAGDVMATRRLLATAERARKQRDLSRDELLTLWESQLTLDERQAISRLRNQSTQSPSDEKRVSLADAVQWAEEHLFDRNSVVLECQVWQEALGRARGEPFSVSELTDFTRQRGYIRDEARPGEVTLRDVLLREWEIVQTAKEGVGDFWPLITNPRPVNPQLDGEQRQALDALLSSTNAVAIFRGGAGTGKSFVLRELAEQLQHSGRRVIVLAPQRQQVVDMEKAGLPSPSTVASFLLKRELVAGAVVVVDEAGQIGGRQMLELIRLVRERNARLILSGDTRQHGAVEASDALLAIEDYRYRDHIGIDPYRIAGVIFKNITTGKTEGAPPPVDLADEIKAGNLVRSLIRDRKVAAVHDCSDGGLLVAVAEMALKGEKGVALWPYEGKLPAHAAWFGEDQGRYVLEAAPDLAEEIIERAKLLGLPARVIGKVGGDTLTLKGEPSLALEDIRKAHEGWLPAFMAGND